MGREGHLHRCSVTNLAECQKYRNLKILGSVLAYYGHYTVGLYCGTLWYLELNLKLLQLKLLFAQFNISKFAAECPIPQRLDIRDCKEI